MFILRASPMPPTPYRELPTRCIGNCLRGVSGVAYVAHRELYIRPPIQIWLVQYPKSRLTQFVHYPKKQKYIYSSDSLPQEWISQSFSLTCPTKVKIPKRDAYFPEANVLVPLDSVAIGSNTPTSKWVEVSLQPHKG